MRQRALPLILRTILLIVAASLSTTCLVTAFTLETGRGPTVIRQHWPDYYRSMAEREPRQEESWLKQLLTLEPRDSDAAIRLAAVAEWRHDLSRARPLLEFAAAHDARYRAQWAHFAFESRHPGQSDPWAIARRCFTMSYGDRRTLLDAVWLLKPDGRFLVDNLLPDSPATLYQATIFLMDQNDLPAARKAFDRLIRQPFGSTSRANAGIVATALERSHLGLDLTDLHLDRRDPESALAIWQSLIAHSLLNVDEAGVAGQQPVNSRFRTEPLGRGFDWRLTPTAGIEMRKVDDGWRVDFGHHPPDRAPLLNQRIIIRQRVMPVIEASAPAWVQATITDEIAIPRSSIRMARLRIEYRRPPGQPPLREPLIIRQVRWRPS